MFFVRLSTSFKENNSLFKKQDQRDKSNESFEQETNKKRLKFKRYTQKNKTDDKKNGCILMNS